MTVTSVSPTLQPTMFQSELSTLTFTVPDGTASAVFAVLDSTDDIVFRCTYIPDASGRIVVYGVDRLLAPLLESSLIAHVRFRVNGSDLFAGGIDVVRCSVRVEGGLGASGFLNSRWLSVFQSDVRVTAIGWSEQLHAYTSSKQTCTVEARFVDVAAGKVCTRTTELQTADGFITLDASPSTMDLVMSPGDGWQLTSYTVRLGVREQVYRVMRSDSPDVAVFSFDNCFGLSETLHLRGVRTSAPTYERSSALVNGAYTCYDVDAEAAITLNTCPLDEGVDSLVLDMLRSRRVTALSDDYGTVRNAVRRTDVVVTDCNPKFSDDPSDALSVEITYRPASRVSSSIVPVLRERTFDETFDETFD